MVKEGKLTKRQKDILEYIKKFSAQKKYPPSIREIAANFSLSSPATCSCKETNWKRIFKKRKRK